MKNKLIANKHTLIGYLGLVCWSISPVLAALVKTIPTFEILTISLGVSFAISLVYIIKFNLWEEIFSQPWYIWIIGILGVYGNDIFYIEASKHARVEHVGLICYLWPVVVILLSSFFPSEKIKLHHFLSVIIGFCAVLTIQASGASDINANYFLGYLYALLGVFAWSMFVVFSRIFKQTPPYILGMFFGFGMLFSCFMHFNMEEFVIPNISQALVLLIMGIFTHGLAYYLWDIGIKKGDFKLLTVLSFSNPLLSIVFLMILGLASFSINLIFACMLVVLAGITSRYSPRHLFKRKSFAKLVKVI